jgi:hypothetical protein
MCELTDKITRLARLKVEKELYAMMSRLGKKRSEVEYLDEKFADRKPEDGENYYYYSGPLDEKTRPFCKLMLKMDKVFSESEIEYMSAELGYPVLKYRGSYNCRHKWVRFRGKRILTPAPTVREIRKLINNGIEA